VTWSPKEISFLSKINSPDKIQTFLDSLKYNPKNYVRSPRFVFKEKMAHCFDGALFAAAALDFHNIKSSLVALYANGEDDDHVITVFKVNGYYGALAKSNYVPLRYRDPIYKNLRELVMSYFDGYFRLDGVKTLRAYSNPLALSYIRPSDWRFSEENMEPLGTSIDMRGKNKIFRASQREVSISKLLRKADRRSILGASIGIDKKGIY
jgi:hypothetical protein